MTLTDRNSSNKQHEGRITITHHNTLGMGGSSEETVEYFRPCLVTLQIPNFYTLHHINL
jgi:hypothetical protein